MNLEFKNFLYLTKDEHQKLLDIRNDENIKKYMRDNKTIKLENHLLWLKGLNEKSLYFAVFKDKNLIGCVDITSINLTKKTSSWGFYFENTTSAFVASICVYLLIEKIFDEKNIEKITSEVKKTNENAYKFNLSFGFLPIYEDEEYFFLELKKQNWQKSTIHRLKKKIDKIDYKFV